MSTWHDLSYHMSKENALKGGPVVRFQTCFGNFSRILLPSFYVDKMATHPSIIIDLINWTQNRRISLIRFKCKFDIKSTWHWICLNSSWHCKCIVSTAQDTGCQYCLLVDLWPGPCLLDTQYLKHIKSNSTLLVTRYHYQTPEFVAGFLGMAEQD